MYPGFYISLRNQSMVNLSGCFQCYVGASVRSNSISFVAF